MSKISINVTYNSDDPKAMVKSLLKITDIIENEVNYKVTTIKFENEDIIKDFLEIKV